MTQRLSFVSSTVSVEMVLSTASADITLFAASADVKKGWVWEANGKNNNNAMCLIHAYGLPIFRPEAARRRRGARRAHGLEAVGPEGRGPEGPRRGGARAGGAMKIWVGVWVVAAGVGTLGI